MTPPKETRGKPQAFIKLVLCSKRACRLRQPIQDSGWAWGLQTRRRQPRVTDSRFEQPLRGLAIEFMLGVRF